jgi:hypothetical protein
MTIDDKTSAGSSKERLAEQFLREHPGWQRLEKLGVKEFARWLDQRPPSETEVEPRPSDDRNGCFLDKMWCCKVCDGEIPDGHTNECDIWKLEKKHRDFLANEYNAVLTERDRLRATLAARATPETSELLSIAREVSTMDCFHTGASCPAGCGCLSARAGRALHSPCQHEHKSQPSQVLFRCQLEAGHAGEHDYVTRPTLKANADPTPGMWRSGTSMVAAAPQINEESEES